MRSINSIIIHNSATKDGSVVDVQAIRRYHTSYAYQGNIIKKTDAMPLIEQGKTVKKPWADIGYHFLCEKVNDRYEILVGRMWNIEGAHATGHNFNTIGVCAVGAFETEPPPAEQWQMLVKLCVVLADQYSIKPENIKGHRELGAPKTCPGTMFDMNKFRADVAKGVIACIAHS